MSLTSCEEYKPLVNFSYVSATHNTQRNSGNRTATPASQFPSQLPILQYRSIISACSRSLLRMRRSNCQSMASTGNKFVSYRDPCLCKHRALGISDLHKHLVSCPAPFLRPLRIKGAGDGTNKHHAHSD